MLSLQEIKEQVVTLSRNERLDLIEVIVKSLKSAHTEKSWKFLAPRDGSWRKQLYFKGKRLRAANVYFDMIDEEMTPEEAAADWDLPVEAVLEAIEYCQSNQELLEAEAEAERKSLDEFDAAVLPQKIAT